MHYEQRSQKLHNHYLTFDLTFSCLVTRLTGWIVMASSPFLTVTSMSVKRGENMESSCGGLPQSLSLLIDHKPLAAHTAYATLKTSHKQVLRGHYCLETAIIQLFLDLGTNWRPMWHKHSLGPQNTTILREYCIQQGHDCWNTSSPTKPVHARVCVCVCS